MTFPQSAEPNKKDPTLWIILGIAAVLIFCAGGIGLGALIIHLNQTARAKPTPHIVQPTPRMNPATTAPTRFSATLAPPVTNGPLVVVAFDPTDTSYPTLADLAPGWEDSTIPATRSYSLTVSQNTPITIYLGWCTTTSTLLQDNIQHMSWSLVVDDLPVNLDGLFLWNDQESDRICRSSVGLIRQWTDSQHKIVTTMTISQKINDGWDDYPPGNYVEVYEVTVTP
jgi:hypothetical protein